MLILGSLIALLSGCGPRELARLGFDKVESFRAEQLGLGAVEGTATVSLYNGNKKSVIFDSGRLDVTLNGRTFGVVTLEKAVEVRPGFSKTKVPVRIRFAKDGLKAIAEVVFPRNGAGRGMRRPEVRIAGSLTIVAGNNGPLRQRTVRFDRKVTEKMIGQLGGHSGLLTELMR